MKKKVGIKSIIVVPCRDLLLNQIEFFFSILSINIDQFVSFPESAAMEGEQAKKRKEKNKNH